MFQGEILALTPFDAPIIPLHEEKTPWSVSVIQAFKRESLPLNLYGAVEKYIHQRNFEDDPNFNGWRYLAEQTERLSDIYTELNQNPHIVNNSHSQEELEDNLLRLREEKKMVDEATANGTLPYLVGGFGAVIADPMTWVGIGLLDKAFSRLGMATRGSRFISMGLSGVAEQAITEAGLAANQDLRTSSEIASAIALSGLLSGAVGAVLGGRSPVKSNKDFQTLYKMTETIPADVIPDTMEGRAAFGASTVGAARQTEGSELIKGSRGWLPTRKLMNSATPLGRAVNTVTEWTENLAQKTKQGAAWDAANTAVRKHWRTVEELMDTHLLTKENLEGIPTISAEARKGFYRTWYIDYTVDSRKTFDNTIASIGKVVEDGKYRKINQNMYNLEVGRYSLALEAGIEKEWKPLPEIDALLPNKQAKDAFRQGVIEGNHHLRTFFNRFRDQEIKFNLLTPEDAKVNYFRHQYDMEAIRLDPDMFKNKLRELFLREPDDVWSIQTYGKKFTDLSPDERIAAISDWEFAKKVDAEAAADAAYTSAVKALKEGKVTAKEIAALKTKMGKEKLALSVAQAQKDATIRRAQLEQLHEAIERRKIKLEAAQEKLASLEAKALPKREVDLQRHLRQINKTKGYIQATQTWVAEKAQRYANLANELDRLVPKLERINTHLTQAKQFEKILNRAQQAAQKKLVKLEAKVKKAQAAIEAVQKVKSLDEQVEATFDAIINHKLTPYGFLPQDVVEQSGRMKQRQLRWGKMLNDPELQKFLVVRPDKIALSYTEDIGARLALIENFGEESMAKTLKEVQRAYENAIELARKDGDTTLLGYLQDAYHNANSDLFDLRDKFLGRYGLGNNPNYAVMFWSQQMRNVNFLRMMGRVIFSQLTDPATVVAANDRGLHAFFSKAWKYMAKHGKTIPTEELKRVVEGLEVTTAYNRQITTWGLDDYLRAGSGIGHGVTKKLTSQLESTTEAGIGLMNRLNLMLPWNKAMRNISGELFLGKAARELPLYANGRLIKEQVGKWARLGIDQQMAARIARLLHEASDVVDDVVYPNLAKWVKRDPEAHRAFVTAMGTLQNEALIIPGLGDLPKFCSNPLAKLLMQFQSFNFAAMGRYTRPMLQRAWGNHEAGFVALNFISAISLGFLGMTVRPYLAGTDPKHWEKQLEDFSTGKDLNIFWEAFLRSPLPGHMATPVEFIGKTGGASLNKWMAENLNIPGVFPGVASRTAERSAATTLLGPSFGTFETFVSMLSHTVGMLDPESEPSQEARLAARHLTRLLPFNNLWFSAAAMRYMQDYGLVPKLVE